MKTISILILSLVVSLSTLGQNIGSEEKLEITFNKTSTVVFPTVIKSVDRGSPDVLAQIVKGAENVLQLKAATVNFPETNLTVITSDGGLHEFQVLYADQPIELSHVIAGTQDLTPSLIKFESDITEAEMETLSQKILSDKSTLLPPSDRNHKMKLTLANIYVHENIMLYKVQVVNRSNINFDLEYMHFFIKDKTSSKRTASQELELVPIFINGNSKSVRGQSNNMLVFALEKFTIPDAKRLTIEVFEHHGGRHLKLKVKNRRIVRAELL